MGSSIDDGGGSPPQGKYLEQGDVVAGRFRVERFASREVVGENWIATDTKNDRPVSIMVIPPESLAGPNAHERVKAEMRSASQLTHKNISTTFGMGQLESGAVYITGEWVDGEKLSSLVEEKKGRGETFSLRGAYSLIAHLCNALEFAHKTRIHGSLSPESIVVSDAGRVKIVGFPLSRLLYMVPTFRSAVPPAVQAYWAPEIKSSQSVISHRADVWSLGALLHELLVGAPPSDGRIDVATARPELPSGVEDILYRCLDPEPANRWKSVLELKEALATIVEKEIESQPEDAAADPGAGLDGLDIEIDVDRPLSVPPPPAGAPPPPKAPPSPPPASSSPGLPDLPAPPEPEDDEHRPSLGPLNLDAILSSVKDQDAEKWMVTKDKMDHGPFKTREVVQMIVRWEIEGQHMIQDIETGIRKKVREHEEFKEIVERARVAKQQHEEQLALEQSEKSERRGGLAKAAVVAIVVGVIALIVGSIFAGRAIYKSATEPDEQDIDDLIASGELKIDMGEGGIVDKKKRKGKRKGGRSGGGGGGGGGSYEDYMNQAVGMGDLGSDGGQTQLSQAQINAVMSKQGKKIYPCIYGELKRNPGLKKVALKFGIEGATGKVKGVTVTSPASDELKKCVQGKMKKITFPKFGAPRMGATFYFDVG